MNPGAEHHSDLELVQAVLAGSPEAEERLIQRLACIPAILKRKNRKLPFPFNTDELQDLAQDVFARIWSKLDTFAGEGCLEAWAYRFCHYVVMNAAHGRWRKHRVGEDLVELEPAGDGKDMLAFGDRVALFEAVKSLDPEESEVIELKHFEGLSFTDIAERIAVSANSAKTRYYRGLRKLEQRLGPLFREEPA